MTKQNVVHSVDHFKYTSIMYVSQTAFVRCLVINLVFYMSEFMSHRQICSTATSTFAFHFSSGPVLKTIHIWQHYSFRSLLLLRACSMHAAGGQYDDVQTSAVDSGRRQRRRPLLEN
jgi:hypothetical protein